MKPGAVMMLLFIMTTQSVSDFPLGSQNVDSGLFAEIIDQFKRNILMTINVDSFFFFFCLGITMKCFILLNMYRHGRTQGFAVSKVYIKMERIGKSAIIVYP